MWYNNTQPHGSGMDGAVGGCFGKEFTMSEETIILIVILLMLWITRK